MLMDKEYKLTLVKTYRQWAEDEEIAFKRSFDDPRFSLVAAYRHAEAQEFFLKKAKKLERELYDTV